MVRLVYMFIDGRFRFVLSSKKKLQAKKGLVVILISFLTIMYKEQEIVSHGPSEVVFPWGQSGAETATEAEAEGEAGS